MTLTGEKMYSAAAQDSETKTAPAEIIKQALDAIETRMHSVVDSDVSTLRDASRHILGAGGKRIRPRLMLLSYLANGGSPAAVSEISSPAAAIELVHTASVVHDDINDHGVVRRGRPSVNALWGRTFALLTGDFLFTKVYELMAPYHDLNIPLAEATVALVEGETLQAQAVKENNFTRETYTRIIGLKTAALFGAAAKIGATMAGASEAAINTMYQFGFNLGLAFQIVDDVLDIIGDEQQLGKTSGIDLAQGRGFAAAYKPDENGVAAVDAGDPMASIKRRVLQGDALDEARHQSQALVALAVDQIAFLPETPYRDGLADLAHLVIERSF